MEKISWRNIAILSFLGILSLGLALPITWVVSFTQNRVNTIINEDNFSSVGNAVSSTQEVTNRISMILYNNSYIITNTESETYWKVFIIKVFWNIYLFPNFKWDINNFSNLSNETIFNILTRNIPYYFILGDSKIRNSSIDWSLNNNHDYDYEELLGLFRYIN